MNLSLPNLSPLNGTWNTAVQAVTQLVPVCSVTLSLTFWVIFESCLFYIFYLEIPKQANTWLPWSFVLLLCAVLAKESGWRSFTGWGKVLAVLEYPSTWDKNRYNHFQQVVLGSSAAKGQTVGYLCYTGKGLRWISNIMFSQWDVSPHPVHGRCRTCMMRTSTAAEQPSGM